MGCFFISRQVLRPANLYLGIYFYIVKRLIDPEKDDDKLTPDPPADIANNKHDQSSYKSTSAQQAEWTKTASSISLESSLAMSTEHSGETAKRDQDSNYCIHYLNYLQSDHGTEG